MDEEDLEDELNDMQQQELDNKVLDAGTLPVSDKVSNLPNAGDRVCTYFSLLSSHLGLRAGISRGTNGC